MIGSSNYPQFQLFQIIEVPLYLQVLDSSSQMASEIRPLDREAYPLVT